MAAVDKAAETILDAANGISMLRCTSDGDREAMMIRLFTVPLWRLIMVSSLAVLTVRTKEYEQYCVGTSASYSNHVVVPPRATECKTGSCIISCYSG